MYDLINKYFKDNKYIEFINNYVVIIDEFVIKRINVNNLRIYKTLKEKHVEGINYPINLIKHNNEYFYVFKRLKDNNLNDELKIKNFIDKVFYMHELTFYNKIISDIELKKFKRIYEKLDFIFSNIELNIRVSEMNNEKSDSDWIKLSKYHIVLDAKKYLREYQLKIQKRIKEGLELKYSIIHNNLSINHYVDGFLISFNNAKFGYYVIDYAKLYILNDNLKYKFKDEFEKIFNDFDKLYFKFLVLYIYILNIEFIGFDIVIERFLCVTKSINKFLNDFKDWF